MEADRMTIEILVFHCSMDPCLKHQWRSGGEKGPDCSIFSNEAIRRAGWMEIRLSFTVPLGNEWNKENQGEQNGCLRLHWFLQPRRIKRPCENWSEQGTTFDIDEDKMEDSPTPKVLDTGEKSRSCERQPGPPMKPYSPARNTLAKGKGFQTRQRPLGRLLWLQGQSLKCLIKLNKSKHYI